METSVADVIASVVQLVGYLRATTDAPPDEGWLRCDQLSRGGPPLVGLIERIGTERGTRAPDVAASLFSLSYAFQIGAIPLAAHALGLPVPDARPEVMAISVDPDRPATVALLAPRTGVEGAAELAHRLLAGHLGPLFEAIRQEVTIGERLLWANAAASFSRVFRAIEGADGVDRSEVRRRADVFFAAAGPWLDGLGRFETVAVGTRDGWFWTRSSCCLWYQASGGSMCDDCSLIPDDERRALRRGDVLR